MKKTPLTIALPKGRLYENVKEYFSKTGLFFEFEKRKLVAEDETGSYRFYLVKNHDLPTYVNHGITGLGICGEDVIYESGLTFNKLYAFPFGGTRLSLAGKEGDTLAMDSGKLTVATSYTRMTRDYFHKQGIPVKIIKLNGSVELAPVLGLAPYIVDLVETGNTLKANKLEVLEEMINIKVHLIANPSYYKVYYKEINTLTEILEKGHKNG